MSIGTCPRLTLAQCQVDAATRSICPILDPWIPPELDQYLSGTKPGDWYGNVLTPNRVLRLLLLQALKPGGTFAQLVRQVWQTWRFLDFPAGQLPTRGALARARARFPECALEMLFKSTVQAAAALPEPPTGWPGRVLCADGTPLLVPRSEVNLAHFNATRHQHGQAYWPRALAVWLSRLSLHLIVGEYMGTSNEGDESVAPYLLGHHLQPGDLALGDAHFGNYPTLATCSARSAYYLMRAPGALHVEAHITQRYTPRDADLVLRRTAYIASRYSDLGLPETLSLRTLLFELPAHDGLNGYERAHFLTNIERARFSWAQIEPWVKMRWRQETLNNDVKTFLDLGMIRSESPAGVRQEVLAHLCVSNVIHMHLRRVYPDQPELGSFTAARDALLQANEQLRAHPSARDKAERCVDEVIRAESVEVRPGRSEPRMKRPARRIFPVFKIRRAAWRQLRKEAKQTQS